MTNELANENTPVVEEIVLDQDTHQNIKDEYEKMGGQSIEQTDKNKSELSDETFEAMITDPSLILKDVRKLAEKHGINYVDLLNKMGFTLPILKAVILNKPITEQIYVFSRELSLVLFSMGEESGTVEEGYNTVNIRSLLGEIRTSGEWLELLDTQIFPFIKYFNENGKIDKDWFTREENKMADISEVEAMADIAKQTFDVQSELTKEVEQMNTELQNLFEGDNEEAEDLSLNHGEESVMDITGEEVKEAQENVSHQGEIEVNQSSDEQMPFHLVESENKKDETVGARNDPNQKWRDWVDGDEYKSSEPKNIIIEK